MATTEQRPLVHRVDHVIIRVDNPGAYADLYGVLSETLQLPTPWPVNQQPGFKSGGIFAGNVDFEILQVGRTTDPTPPRAPDARLYGVVFENQGPFDAFHDDLKLLRQRGIPYLPSPYAVEGPDGEPETVWTNIFVANMLGSNLWMRLFFLYKRLITDRVWLRLAASGSANNEQAARFLFNQVYPNAIVFTVKYDPEWRDIEAERRESEAALAERDGGALGLRRVQTIVLGSDEPAVTRSQWNTLLRPWPATGGDTWRVGDGPAIQVVSDTRKRLKCLIWEVASLDRATEFLRDQDMLDGSADGAARIDPASLFGLDIRLVE